MKAIIIDFNGVLDTYLNMDVIDPDNLNILLEAIQETEAKVVVSSSIKNAYFYSGKHSSIMKYLIDIFSKNNIEIYGITPYLENREFEIIEYLSEHPEITEYCIIDDDYFFESMKDHMIKLTPQLTGGNGLKEIDADTIIKVLKK